MSSSFPVPLVLQKNTPPARSAQAGAVDPGGIIVDGVTLTVTNQGVASAVPPPPIFAQIAKVTVPADTNQLAIAAIPNTFSNLMLMILFPQRAANGNAPITMQFNGDTAAHYAWQSIIGDNNNAPTSAASGFTDTSIQIGAVSGSENGTSGIATVTLTIVNYRSTTTGKGITGTNYSTGNLGSGRTTTIAGQFLSLAAIASIQVNASGNNIKAGAVATLYGML